MRTPITVAVAGAFRVFFVCFFVLTSQMFIAQKLLWDHGCLSSQPADYGSVWLAAYILRFRGAGLRVVHCVAGGAGVGRRRFGTLSTYYVYILSTYYVYILCTT